MSKNVAIAYCAENQNTVREIDRKLSLAGYDFQHFSCSKTTLESPLSDHLTGYGDRVVLVVSDNFLKSAQCMSRALKLMQKKGEQILAVVVDGEQKADDGSTVYTPTNFDRVSDIIQYINYWQDLYLDLRRQKRDISPGDEEQFNAHLKAMREISSEVGEFLRVLRNSNYMPWDEFSRNDFERFFAFLGDRTGWESYQRIAPSLSPSESAPVETPLADMGTGADDVGAEEPKSAGAGEETPTPVYNEIAETVAAEERAELELIVPKDEEPGVDAGSGLVAEEEETTGEGGIEEPLANVEWDIEIEKAAEEEPTVETEAEAPAETIQVDLPAFEEEAEQETEEEEEQEIEEEEPIEEAPAGQVAEIIERSEELFAAQQAEEGFDLLERSLTKSPGNIDLRYHYALSLAQLRDDFSAASTQLETVLELDPSHVDAHFLLGKLSEINENYEAAAGHYEKVVQLEPEHDPARFQLGILLANHFPDQWEAAAFHLKKAYQANPENAEACYRYGLILHEQLQKPKKAAKYLQKTIELAPEHPFAHYDLALIYHALGESEQAYEAYQRAIEINPEVQTPDNDAAFAPASEPEEEVVVAAAPVPETPHQAEAPLKASLETDTIEALKQNIYRLEEMIKAKQKEEEEKAARAAMAPPPPPKKEQTVFITGATSGIGRATAEKFASEGYRLILNGRRIDRLEALAKELTEAYGCETLLLPFDVRDVDAVQAAVDSLEGSWRNIDILMNNAGKAKGLDWIHEGQLRHWEEMIDTNIKGLLYLTRTVAPSMVERRSGHIINVCSTAGHEVYPKGNVYCATKFAVDALTKSMRIDLHTHNIRVSQVSPGHVEETEFAAVRFDGDTEKAKIYQDFLPLNARDIAETVFFIASQPKHVNIQDVLIMGTQQASNLFVDRSGRDALE